MVELSTNVNTGDVKINTGQSNEATITRSDVVTKEEPKPDLISRVSQFKPEEKKPEEGQTQTEQTDEHKAENPFGLTREDWDKVNNDPTLSKYYKSMQSDYGKKTQEIAEERRKLSERVRELESKVTESSIWTPERIQQLLHDQSFVNAAQTVAQSQAPSNFEGTQEEWSGLSDGEKVKFQNMERKIAFMEQQSIQAQREQEHNALKSKYANYDPKAIDMITADILAQKAKVTLEHVYKAYDYEDAVKRAYELGRQDRQLETREKLSSASIEGMSTMSTKDTPQKNQGENDRDYFRRIFLHNVAKGKQATIQK